MSDVTPNPEANGDVPFDFNGLSADTIAPEEAPPVFDAPRKPKWWDRWFKNTSAGPKKPKPRKVMPSMPRGGLRKPLADIYTSMGMLMMPFDASCAKVIIENAPRCAETLDDLAKTNPAVRRILISLVTTSALSAVMVAHAPIVMAVAMHHIPALKDKQEKMIGEFAEMMANMPTTNGDAE